MKNYVRKFNIYGSNVYIKAPFITIADYEPSADGTLHKLSERYTTLAKAQEDYPVARTLDDSIDWAALQQAISDAEENGALVFIPSGHYYCNKTITIDSQNNKKISVIGEGADSTRLEFPTSDGIDFIGTLETTSDKNISMQTLDGISLIGSANQNIGLKLTALAMVNIRNLYVGGFETGIFANGVDHSIFENVVMRFNKKGSYFHSSDILTYTECNNNAFYNCQWASNSLYGGYFDGMSNIGLFNSAVENNGTDNATNGSADSFGLKFYNGGYQGGVACTLNNVYFESNAGIADLHLMNIAWLEIDNSDAYNVQGCSFNKTRAAWYSTYNILCTFGDPTQVEHQKLIAIGNTFKKLGDYVPNASRKSIAYNGVVATENNYINIGNIFAITEEA